MKPEALTATLHEQVFDSHHPGSVLADFRMLLDFIGTHGVVSSGKLHLLPIASLPELNARLTKPMRVNLKRPQQRSLPYLSALYLLLRATGLVQVAAAGAKARLVVDPDVLASWQSLNATEQYFTLLEAWLIHASPAHLGERVNTFRDGLFLYHVLQIRRTSFGHAVGAVLAGYLDSLVEGNSQQEVEIY